MGMSAGAQLCYGVICAERTGDEYSEEVSAFPWPNPGYDEPEYTGPESLAEKIALELGITNPYDEPDWNDPKWDDAKEARRLKIKEIEAAIPIEIVSYGYYDGYRSEIVALKGTVVRASEYGAVTLTDPDRLLPGERMGMAILAAKAFCEKHGVCPFDNPSWVLAASYG